MKVTNIKQQLRRSDRFSIYVDNKYTFSLSEAELVAIKLKVGQEFTQGELAELKQRAVVDKGFDRALNLISRRPRSEWELRTYLKRKDYDEDSTISILNKLRDIGYVDDRDFAERWVENRRLLKPISKRKLIQELRSKRIDNETIENVMNQDETDDVEALRNIIVSKRRQTKYQDDLKLIQYLSRQGYNYGDIKNVLSEIDN